MTEKSNLENQIKQIQNTYYNENNKNMFIKTKQKFSCAENVSTNVGIDNLIEQTVHFNDANTLCFDYVIFKTYAHPDMYKYFGKHICNMLQYGIDNFNSVNIIVNIKSLTITAIERYKDIIMYLSTIVPINILDNIDEIQLTNSTNMTKTIMPLLSSLFTKESMAKIKSKLVIA
jgi:hypothetical protein